MAKDPFLDYPDEGKAYHYVVQHHYRGKTVHCDLRLETNQGFLIGWTLLDGITGEIKEPVMTLAQAKELDAKDIFKIDWKKGEVKEREVRGGAIRPADVRAVEKKPEPLEWLDVEGVTPPGSVGATKEFPGVFTIIDKGIAEYGAQKPYFHEYFFTQGKLKGRFAFRMIGRKAAKESAFLPPGIEEEAPRVPYYWVLIQPIDQTPYVLSQGAIEKNWLPPKGISAIPKAMRAHIPERLKFWKLPKKEALEARKELATMEELVPPRTTHSTAVNRVTGNQVTVNSSFILQHHWWRGQIVVRFGPSTEHWDLRIRQDKKIWHLVLKNNPLETESVMGYEKPCDDPAAMEKGKKGAEELEPGTSWNPTRDTPAFIKALDFGTCTTLEDSDTFKKVEFQGQELKGLYAFTREDPESDFWIMSPSDLPTMKQSVTLKKGGLNMSTEELTLEAEEQKVEEAEEKKPSEKAIQALKEALELLKPFKDRFSKRTQFAVDVIAGGAGYGYPEPSAYPKPYDKEPYKYPEPGEYPKPLAAEPTDALKEALAKLKPVKDELSDRVKYAIDVLAGAAGYGYPEPYGVKHELMAAAPTTSDLVSHSLEVTIIKPGETKVTLDGKTVVYPEEVLKDSLPLWDGATAFCDHFNKSVRNIVGVFYQPWWDSGIKAKLRILDDNVYKFISQLIADREAKLPIPDVGISADLQVATLSRDGMVDVTQILRVNSADIVFSPAAGGSFDRVLNAAGMKDLAAGISLPQSEQNEPETGSPPQEGQSEEELVPVTRVRDLQSSNDKLRADLKEKETLTLRLQQDMGEAVSKYRDVLLKANPGIPEELIQGNSIEELDSSVGKAHAVVEKIKSSIEESSRIPAGAPVRAGIDISALSPAEKVVYGLAHPPK